MPNEPFRGKPPKSAEQIRRILESVHEHNPPKIPGPFAHGLTDEERQMLFSFSRPVKRNVSRPRVQVPAAVRSPAYYRQLLLRKGGISGGIVGLLLGLNLGVAIPIVIGNASWFAFAPITMSLIGWSLGVFVSRAHVIARRPDLFGPRQCLT
jgi:hypothetical protein